MVSRREKLSLLFKNLKNFAAQYRRNKFGMIGLIILLLFAFVAIAAPIITPHDPMLDRDLAGWRAKPVWLAGSTFSKNIFPIEDPHFSGEETAFDQWTQFSFNDTSADSLSINWDDKNGDPYGSGSGCLNVTFHRSQINMSLDNTIVTLEKTFDYSYSAPERFVGEYSLKADIQPPLRSGVTLQFWLKTPDNSMYRLYYRDYKDTTPGWIKVTSKQFSSKSLEVKKSLYPDLSIVAQLSKMVEKELFKNNGEYTLIIRIIFKDADPLETSRITLLLDDVDFRIVGDTFGLLGTDHMGRDLFSQLVYGTRLSFIIGILSAVIAVSLGVVVGLISGYFGGVVDEILMRVNDILLVIPRLPLLMVMIVVLGASIWNIVLLIGLLGWMSIARVIRSMSLSLKERTFVEAAKAVGGGNLYIVFKHILPNVLPLVWINLALTVPDAIVSEASLSFIGLGDPTAATWGQMLYNAQRYIVIKEWWWYVPPGLAIGLLALSFMLIGYAMDEILNPRLRRR